MTNLEFELSGLTRNEKQLLVVKEVSKPSNFPFKHIPCRVQTSM